MKDRMLPPTPRTVTGAPPRTSPGWLVDLLGRGPQAVEQWWAGVGRTPVVGPVLEHDGVDVCEVTFVAQVDPGPEQAAVEVMVHLNGLTDHHRRDITPSLMEPVPGSQLRHLTLLLPVDGTWSYRLVHGSPLDRHAGASREGWRAVHLAGRVDPRNPRRLHDGQGADSSVWSGPGARLVDGWPDAGSRHAGMLVEREVLRDDGARRPVWVLGAGRLVLVIFDGALWRSLGIVDALAACAPLLPGGEPPSLVLVDSIDHQRRALDLTDEARLGALLGDALDVAAPVLGGLPDPGRVVVAGQSFGGLAAALAVVHHPQLARTAIVQSGSFWYDPDRPTSPDQRGPVPGRLARQLCDPLDLAGRRLLVQAGTDEGEMDSQALWMVERLRGLGAEASFDHWRGGHDHAWWRHGLVFALSQLG
ncbi:MULTISPECIES: enterochelin esterase domain-containing protein [unclassified Luteococcus]|uniref:enterochelin esterase domain-containing protein n=1 Tax=unclassified Luteococcus TaxID=2639923 RepID=UPI00313CB6C9